LPEKIFAWTFAILATVLLCAGISLVCVGWLLALPAGSAAVADAVVVLGGGGDNERFLRGRTLVSEGLSSRLVLIHPSLPEVAEAKSLLAVVGLRPANLFVDDRPAENTWQEAVSARRLMTEQGWTRVLVVSDPPHLLRVNYAWSSVFAGTGLSFTLIRTDPTWWTDWRWWRNPRATLFVKEEVLKLAYYLARYRFGVGQH